MGPLPGERGGSCAGKEVCKLGGGKIEEHVVEKTGWIILVHNYDHGKVGEQAEEQEQKPEKPSTLV